MSSTFNNIIKHLVRLSYLLKKTIMNTKGLSPNIKPLRVYSTRHIKFSL